MSGTFKSPTRKPNAAVMKPVEPDEAFGFWGMPPDPLNKFSINRVSIFGLIKVVLFGFCVLYAVPINARMADIDIDQQRQMIKWSRSSDVNERSAALGTVFYNSRMLSPKAVVSVLLSLLRDSNYDIRSEAVVAAANAMPSLAINGADLRKLEIVLREMSTEDKILNDAPVRRPYTDVFGPSKLALSAHLALDDMYRVTEAPVKRIRWRRKSLHLAKALLKRGKMYDDHFALWLVYPLLEEQKVPAGALLIVVTIMNRKGLADSVKLAAIYDAEFFFIKHAPLTETDAARYQPLILTVKRFNEDRNPRVREKAEAALQGLTDASQNER